MLPRHTTITFVVHVEFGLAELRALTLRSRSLAKHRTLSVNVPHPPKAWNTAFMLKRQPGGARWQLLKNVDNKKNEAEIVTGQCIDI